MSKDRYLYGMRLRGFSPGCQPMQGLIGRREFNPMMPGEWKRYHDILVYDRELTERELEYFELDALTGQGVR